MKAQIIFRVVFVALFAFSFFPRLGHGQWQLLGQVREENDYPDFITFLDDQGSPNIGFAAFYRSIDECADGFCDSLFKTTDHGATWKGLTSFSLNNQVQYIVSAVFKDSLTGWVCTDEIPIGSGYIYATSDGGITWNLVTTYPKWVINIFYNASSKCVIATTGDGLGISRNDGKTFSFVPANGNSTWTNITFFDEKNYVASGNLYVDLRTSDGGVTWLSENAPNPLWECRLPYYSSITGELYAVTAGSVNGRDTLYVSKDQGRTWVQRYLFRYQMFGELVGSCKGIAAVAYPDPSTTWFSSDFGFTWDSIGPKAFCDGAWGFLDSYGGICMTHNGLYVCSNDCQVREFALPTAPLSFSSSTAITKNGYETDLTVSLDSSLKQYPINSFEALINANFNFKNVGIQPWPGWSLDTSSLDSESLSLTYTRDTNAVDSNVQATISFIYSDSVSKSLQFSVTPILFNGQTITECIDDTNYTFSPRCQDPILRNVLNGEAPLDFRVFQEGDINIASLTVRQPSGFRIEAMNTLGETIGPFQLGELSNGNYQYDLGALFPNQRYMFVRIASNDGTSVVKVPVEQ